MSIFPEDTIHGQPLIHEALPSWAGWVDLVSDRSTAVLGAHSFGSASDT
jgi:hypothetical protein